MSMRCLSKLEENSESSAAKSMYIKAIEWKRNNVKKIRNKSSQIKLNVLIIYIETIEKSEIGGYYHGRVQQLLLPLIF